MLYPFGVMTIQTYKEALKQLKKDLADATAKLAAAKENVQEQERHVAQLRQSIATISLLAGEDWLEDGELGITDAVKLVMSAADGPMNPKMVKERIEGMGFYKGKYENLLAAVHTIMRRLKAKGLIKESDKREGLYEWAGTTR
jgi:hypothetical protein